MTAIPIVAMTPAAYILAYTLAHIAVALVTALALAWAFSGDRW